MSPRIIITCGPAIAPIDDVRRISNFATGEIGTLLANEFLARGWRVLCLRGEAATAPPPAGCEVVPFSTNASLAALLEREAGRADAVLQAAALCDYEVARRDGSPRKIRSDGGPLTLELVPAQKLLPLLRPLFRSAILLGWKYELDGSRPDAISRGADQVRTCSTDGCIVNGAAFGTGFGFVDRSGQLQAEWPDKARLAPGLADWLAGRWSMPVSPAR